MLDQYGRTIEYLRVSVTDRCNLRCRYCMPEEGVELLQHEQILSYDEIERIVRLCAKMGISKVKLTGGEPLVRKGLSSLLRRLKRIDGIEDVTLTTNGVLLESQIDDLVEAGLTAVNISLDTLDRAQYEELTRRDQLEEALRGLEAALSYPQLQVKINCVTLLGKNEEQWTKLAAFAKEKPVDVRFIEMMPIGIGQSDPNGSQKIVYDHLVQMFGEARNLSGRFGNGPAVYKQFPEFKGKIGFISAVSHQFCDGCNRIRLTADGFLKPCLQYSTGKDLKELLRSGKSDQEIFEAIKETIYRKPRSHQFKNSENEGHMCDTKQMEQRKMSSIGG